MTCASCKDMGKLPSGALCVCEAASSLLEEAPSSGYDRLADEDMLTDAILDWREATGRRGLPSWARQRTRRVG